MPNSINDWIVELGFDSSKVDKGLTRVEKRFARFRKKINADLGSGLSSLTKQRQPLRQSVVRKRLGRPTLLGDARSTMKGSRSTTKEKPSNSLLKANALERKRQETQQIVNRAKKVGIDPTDARVSLKQKNVQLIEKERLALIKKVRVQEKRITVERKEQARVAKVIAAKAKETAKEQARAQRAETARLAHKNKKITFKERLTTEGRISKVASEAKATANTLEGSRDKKAILLKKQLNTEVVKLMAAQKALANTTRVNSQKYETLQRKIDKTTRRVAELKRETASFKRGGGAFGAGMAKMTRMLNPATLAVVALTSAVTLGIPSLFRATRQLDALKASMLAASGSAAQAKIDFEFVRETSNSLGRDLMTSAKGFQMIGTAMRSEFSGDEIREVFLAASESSTAFGISAEDTQGVMKAFSQIASKSSVQAEELRGQLGDRLFGAFQEAAKALGITTDMLNKKLKKGEVSARDLLIPLSKQLRKTARETGALTAGMESLVAVQNRFKLSQTETVEQLSDAGSKDIFKEFFKIGKSLLKMITPIGKAFVKILKPIMVFLRRAAELFEPLVVATGEVIELFVDGVTWLVEWLANITGLNTLLTGTEGRLGAINITLRILTALMLGIKLMFLITAFAVEQIGETLSGWGDSIRDAVNEAKGLTGFNRVFRLSTEVDGTSNKKAVIDGNLRRNGLVSATAQGISTASQMATPTLDRKTKTVINNNHPIINQSNTILEAANPDAVSSQINTATQEALTSALPSSE